MTSKTLATISILWVLPRFVINDSSDMAQGVDRKTLNDSYPTLKHKLFKTKERDGMLKQKTNALVARISKLKAGGIFSSHSTGTYYPNDHPSPPHPVFFLSLKLLRKATR